MLAAIIVTTVVALGVYVTTAYNFSTSELAKRLKITRRLVQAAMLLNRLNLSQFS